MLSKISKEDIYNVAVLAGECFIDDSFYLELSKKREERKEKIINIFKRSIEICLDYGIAFGYKENDDFVAFILAFNYTNLLSYHKDEFWHIFDGSIGEKSFENKLKSEFYNINNHIIGDSKEYIYILAVAVKDEYRQKGIASKLIDIIRTAYPQYNLFTDLSNHRSWPLYERLGFKRLGEEAGCILTRYISKQDETEIDCNNLKLAIPINFDTEKVFGKHISGKTTKLKHSESVKGEFPFFTQSLFESVQARIIDINYEDLLKYQRHINVLNFIEIKCKDESSEDIFLIYMSNNDRSKGLILQSCSEKYLEDKAIEWGIIPDCFISIPILYNSEKELIDSSKDDNYLINRLMTALKFRTDYEAGIPLKNMDGRGFKGRIKRYYLGNVKIQIQGERNIVFNGVEKEAENICEPVNVALLASIDKNTQSGVLHIVSMSCGLLISQLLDSISRNQVSIFIDEGNTETTDNFYSYLANRYKIYKKGSAKAFLTIPKTKKSVPNDLLASLLFCETFYDDGELLGKVVDKEITELLSDDQGNAQYNYASVYTYSNILLQMSESLSGSLTTRVTKESITLFYIELLLFEEAAINIANDEIIKFLTNLDEYSPKAVLKSINIIVSEHVKSMDFWDIQMNYPSSKKSIDDIRKAFKIENLRGIIKRNLEQLLMIYDTRSDIIDKTESSILTTIGAVLTILSVLGLLMDPSQWKSLGVAALIVGLFIMLKNILFKKALKRKGINK